MPPATSLRLVHPAPAAVQAGPPAPLPLGQVLLQRRAVSPADLAKAVTLAQRQEARLEDILLSRGWITEPALMAARSAQWGLPLADLRLTTPDPRLVTAAGPDRCLSMRILPLRRLAGATVIATDDPSAFPKACDSLPPSLGPFVMALASRGALDEAFARHLAPGIAHHAETRVAAADSVRTLPASGAARLLPAAVLLLGLAAFLAPGPVVAGLLGWTVLTLVALTALKAAALIAMLRHRADPPAPLPRAGLAERLPVISLLVALYDESSIASDLLARLRRLDYPRELLDVLLITEEDDATTRDTLSRCDLPAWVRVITVPAGAIRTKPRALNFALPFARGTLVGVYDAEDAPDPAQLRAVVRHFGRAGPNTACLQGVLDFYGERRNWLSRCFAIDYAAWFRVVLPGLARLGLVVPLGGTTLFFRRSALEEVGGWDAHNVTEDADLGLRLARYGYRTELLDSVTEEEPNARVGSWIRQRSRWQKGYALTWAVAMRNPVALWRELGARRFLGVQILFLGTLSQATLAPVLWAFWAFALGLSDPTRFSGAGVWSPLLALIFVTSGLVNLAVAALSLRTARHRHLLVWLPAMIAYNALATFAAFRALSEAVRRPFHWDKTDHGLVAEAHAAVVADHAPAPQRHLSSRESDILAAIARAADQRQSCDGPVTEILPIQIVPARSSDFAAGAPSARMPQRPAGARLSPRAGPQPPRPA